MTAVGGVRAPSLITRSWLVSPASINRQLPGRRSLDSSRIRTRNIHASARASAAASTSAIPHISLHIAASACGKKRKFNPAQDTYEFDPSTQDALGIQSGRNSEEIRRSRPAGGEDAFFVAKVGKQSNATAFGILDGVGGWASHGVDPADFSHGLASYMAKTALGWPKDKLSPLELLETGYRKTVADPTIDAGGTTACVAVAGKEGRMHIANLGDSGFLQLRLGVVHHYSNPQTHAFNTPFQLSITPPHILAQAAIFGGVPLNDAPSKADLADHMLRHGDVVVLATDGVWDNLNSQDVLKIVSNEMRAQGAWQKTDQGFIVADNITELTKPGRMAGRTVPSLQGAIAAAIAGEAKAAGLNEKRDGPFAKETQRLFPAEAYHGGKPDDVSVLVVISIDSSKTDTMIKAKL